MEFFSIFYCNDYGNDVNFRFDLDDGVSVALDVWDSVVGHCHSMDRKIGSLSIPHNT